MMISNVMMHKESEQKVENQLANINGFSSKVSHSGCTHIYTQFHKYTLLSLQQLKKNHSQGPIALSFNLAFTRAYSGLWDVG